MPDINLSLIDLKALSEPACKLIEAVRSAVGLLYEPWHVRRMAKAERDAALIRAKGEVDIVITKARGAEKFTKELEEIALRASERLNNRELRRQMNIESITVKALEELPDSVSEEKVDEDWIAQFFNYCQDVGDEEMQTLWARLLAGEVARPGSYSLRTLQLVRMLRKSDAELFTRFCSYVWTYYPEGAMTHIYNEQTDELLKSKGFHFGDFLHLQSLGLIEGAGALIIYAIETSEPHEFLYYGKRHLITALPPVHLYMRPLTDIGRELAPISGSEPDEEYRVALVEFWIRRKGMKVQVSDDAEVKPSIT